jgi:hypothetical protein
MSETENESESEETETEETGINPNELSEEQLEALSSHPQVRRMLEYEETSIPQISSMLNNLMGSEEYEETYDLLVEGIAERSGRVTQSTVRKVLNGFVDEYQSVNE